MGSTAVGILTLFFLVIVGSDSPKLYRLARYRTLEVCMDRKKSVVGSSASKKNVKAKKSKFRKSRTVSSETIELKPPSSQLKPPRAPRRRRNNSYDPSEHYFPIHLKKCRDTQRLVRATSCISFGYQEGIMLKDMTTPIIKVTEWT